MDSTIYIALVSLPCVIDFKVYCTEKNTKYSLYKNAWIKLQKKDKPSLYVETLADTEQL